MPEVVKAHKMKVVRGKKYYCGQSGCGDHIPATLVCSCGYKSKEFLDPDYNGNVRREMYEHTSEVVKTAGFVFELTE